MQGRDLQFTENCRPPVAIGISFCWATMRSHPESVPCQANTDDLSDAAQLHFLVFEELTIITKRTDFLIGFGESWDLVTVLRAELRHVERATTPHGQIVAAWPCAGQCGRSAVAARVGRKLTRRSLGLLMIRFGEAG